MTEAEALKRFIPILARISTPYERATIVMRVNERINAKDSTHLLGVTYRHIAALAWPSEPARAKQFEDKLTAAVEAGEFVSLIRDGKHLQIEELAAWPDCPAISPDSPLTFWLGEPAPAQTPAPVGDTKPDVTLMATRQHLIDAFGSFTGMNASWFSNIKDTPALLAARKVIGQGGRHFVEPLFCPFEVLQWLIDPARRKGRPLGQDKGWELFERNFPRAYAAFSVGDTRTD